MTRPTRAWSAIKQVQFEKELLWVPRAQRAQLRSYVAGNSMRK